MSAPSYLLPPCPICSVAPRPEHLFRGRMERPQWVFAHRTSAKRGERCFLWLGCKHAEAVAPDATKNPVSPGGFEAVEKAWADATPKLFAEKTATWLATSRDDFARALAEKPFSLALPTHSAAETHEPRKHENQGLFLLQRVHCSLR